jgi:hypothetical protein
VCLCARGADFVLVRLALVCGAPLSLSLSLSCKLSRIGLFIACYLLQE